MKFFVKQSKGINNLIRHQGVGGSFTLVKGTLIPGLLLPQKRLY
jgi:hypothetical protein